MAAGAVVGLAGSMMSGSPDDYSGDVSKQVSNVTGVGDSLKGLATSNQSALDALVAQYSPLFKQQITNSVDSQSKLTGQGDSEWASYVNNFRPAAEKFAANSLNYDTTARRDKAAGDAMATTRTAVDQAGQQLDAGLSAASVDPSSGAAQAQRRILAGQGAAAAAASGNTARKQVEDTGMQYLNQAAGLGQAVASNSMGLSDRAVTAGNNATSTAGQLQTFATAPQTSTAQILGLAGNQYGNAGNMTLGLQSAATDAWAAKDSSTKDWIIGGAKAGASAYTAAK
jgi:hypothetical protein